jgi:IclR family acetate operon transcriptional repressor
MARDFVRQTDSGRFTLGFRLVRLGAAAADRLDLRRLADPILRELAAESNEYVLLAVLHRNEVTIVDSVAPQRSTFLVPRIDFSHTFHCTALGKIFLAYLPDARRQEILQNPLAHFTPYTLIEEPAILAEIDKIRRQGYAVSCNETIEGVTCLGAPIFNAHGKLEAAVSISTASAQLSAENYQPMADILKEKAAAISKQIGF